MAAPLDITRTDFSAADLRTRAKTEPDPRTRARLIAIAMVIEGFSRSVAASAGNVDTQTLRDWVIRYNGEGVDGLRDRPRSGRPQKLQPEQREGVRRMVLDGPDKERDKVVRWRRLDLCRRIFADFRVVLHPRSAGRLLRRLGLCLRVPRPYHPKANFAHQSLFKRYFPAIARRRLPPHAAGRKVEVWVEDEARIGQQGGMTRIWTEKGSSPRAQWDNRRESLDLFGSSCPQRGAAAGIIAPQANTEIMNLLVGEVSLQVEEGSYAIILVDRAGWHLSKRLVLPENTGANYGAAANPRVLARAQLDGAGVEVLSRQRLRVPAVGQLRGNRAGGHGRLEQVCEQSRPDHLDHGQRLDVG